MKIVTRSRVFETNSSSVHSYTCPIKSVIKRQLEEENKKYDSET